MIVELKNRLKIPWGHFLKISFVMLCTASRIRKYLLNEKLVLLFPPYSVRFGFEERSLLLQAVPFIQPVVIRKPASVLDLSFSYHRPKSRAGIWPVGPRASHCACATRAADSVAIATGDEWLGLQQQEERSSGTVLFRIMVSLPLPALGALISGSGKKAPSDTGRAREKGEKEPVTRLTSTSKERGSGKPDA